MIDPDTQLPVGAMVILQAEVGSTVHGTNIDQSGDRDEMGIAIEPPHYVIGMRHWETSTIRTAPDGQKSKPGDLDLQIHSLRKFCRLAAKGNPTMQIPLFVPESARVVCNTLGRELVAKRAMFLSRQCGKAFLGYMRDPSNERVERMGIAGLARLEGSRQARRVQDGGWRDRGRRTRI